MKKSTNKPVYRITLNVVDVKTRIELSEVHAVVSASCPYRAKRWAIRRYKDRVLETWKYNVCEDYELTAKQIDQLIHDGLITPPDLYEVRTAAVEEFVDYFEYEKAYRL